MGRNERWSFLPTIPSEEYHGDEHTGLLIEHYEKVDTKDKGKRPEPSVCRFLRFSFVWV